MTSRLFVLGASCAAVAVLAAGCESTQSKSKKLEREGTGSANAGTIALGGRNEQVEAGRPTLLRAGGGTAVVVELRNTGSTPQADVPVLVDVRDGHGRSLYRNDVDGLQPSLQRMAFLPARGRAYWVNDQVTAAEKPRDAVIRVGRAAVRAPRAKAPRITLERLRFDSDQSGTYANGYVRNESGVEQRNLPIFAVALRGERVVAAGRAIVPRLRTGAGRKPTRFRIFFVGDPRDAELRVTAIPTALAKEAR